MSILRNILPILLKPQATKGRRKGIENLESGNKEEAIKCFEKAISIDPDWQEPRENLKRCKEG